MCLFRSTEKAEESPAGKPNTVSLVFMIPTPHPFPQIVSTVRQDEKWNWNLTGNDKDGLGDKFWWKSISVAERYFISGKFTCLRWKDSESAEVTKCWVYYLHIYIRAEACQILNVLPNYIPWQKHWNEKKYVFVIGVSFIIWLLPEISVQVSCDRWVFVSNSSN